MKFIALIVLALLGSAAGATTHGTYHYSCKSKGDCPPPPVPPTPPVPPVPPVPPAPPALPEIPAAAHAACAGKSAGTSITYVISKSERMTGTCESVDGKMRFDLESYTKE